MFLEKDFFFMQEALSLAKKAKDLKEVPVGAVLVHQDQIIAEGFNQPIAYHDASAHAEIIALRNGGKSLKNYRLIDTTLYVTLEPCIMCLGAILHARLKKVVYGAFDLKAGAVVSAYQLGDNKRFNHQVTYEGGLLSEECAQLLKDFFKERR